jgi:hypothetical protein
VNCLGDDAGLIEAGQSEPRRCCHAFFVPWSDTYYPASMKNLPPAVRRKAIEIANALLKERYPEGQAIRIAIARAKQWALQPGHPAH